MLSFEERCAHVAVDFCTNFRLAQKMETNHGWNGHHRRDDDKREQTIFVFQNFSF
jgi:hypothetical protein